MKNFRPLPTMMVGILIGSAGFLFLASSQHAWVFVLGIVVFSIGEMTCHPKYYSYIGLVAPEDKKAVYMGYAFLYGVIGSLFGSNVGGEMYNAILEPIKGQADVAGTFRNFWLVFAFLGVATAFVLWCLQQAVRRGHRRDPCACATRDVRPVRIARAGRRRCHLHGLEHAGYDHGQDLDPSRHSYLDGPGRAVHPAAHSRLQ